MAGQSLRVLALILGVALIGGSPPATAQVRIETFERAELTIETAAGQRHRFEKAATTRLHRRKKVQAAWRKCPAEESRDRVERGSVVIAGQTDGYQRGNRITDDRQPQPATHLRDLGRARPMSRPGAPSRCGSDRQPKSASRTS